MISPTPQISKRPLRGLPRAVWAVAGLGLLSGGALRLWPLSSWLRPLTPDGTFEPTTASFLDSMWLVAILVGLAGLVLALDSRLRSASVAALAPRTRAGVVQAGIGIPMLAGVAFGLRLAIAVYSDQGLGDDGARVFWLEQWRRNPHFVTTGLWAPGHLYLMALVCAVVRDPLRAGVVLSALASAGSTWILGRAVMRDWGGAAAICAAACVAVLPVSVAHGATPDVNPVFAFLVLAAVGAVVRFARGGSRRWLGLSWICMAFAEWSRFEAFLLVPGVAILLWPRWRTMLLFGVACLVPAAAWHAMALLSHEGSVNVVSVVRRDPTLARSFRISSLFSYLGAFWQGITPPFAACGVLGIVGALRSRRGREWLPVLLLHVAVLSAALLLVNAGTQPRYLVLAGSILAAYSGVFLGGLFEASRSRGVAALACAALLLATMPQRYTGGHDLWIRRDPALRCVAAAVRARSGSLDDSPATHRGSRVPRCDVVWISDEGAYFYACRMRPPAGEYHALSREDSDPVALVSELRAADRIVASVRKSAPCEAQWERFERAAAVEWAQSLAPTEVAGYWIFSLQRLHAPP